MLGKTHDPLDTRAWAIITGLMSMVALAAVFGSGMPDGKVGWICFSILVTVCLGSALVALRQTQRLKDPFIVDDFCKLKGLPRTLAGEDLFERLERELVFDQDVIHIDSRRS